MGMERDAEEAARDPQPAQGADATSGSGISHPVKRRTVLKGMGATAALAVGAELSEKAWSAVVGGPVPISILHARADLTISAVRPDDFLHLTFRFVNLDLDTSDPAHPKLTRANLLKDALVVIDFGPQHVAEQVLWEPGTTDQIPTPGDGMQSRLAGKSTLAFIVPNGVNTIPYDIDTLLDWSPFTQSVVPVALPGTPAESSLAHRAVKIIKFVFPQLRAPYANETAIEVPWWLVLSPSSNAAWQHATEPVTHVNPVDNKARTELWHTRLGSKADITKPDPVRAVWGRDPKFKQYLKNTATPPGISDDLQSPPFTPKEGLPFRMAYTPQDRRDAVNNSANWSASNPLILNSYTPTPFKTDRLFLTALGAYLDIDGVWPTNPFGNSLLEWKNRSTQGRDHYVRIVNKGYLHPWGHEAVLVRESERKFLKGSANPRGAYVVLRTFFVIIEENRSCVGGFGQHSTAAAIRSCSTCAAPTGKATQSPSRRRLRGSRTRTKHRSIRQ
jgi:hypothetical protein